MKEKKKMGSILINILLVIIVIIAGVITIFALTTQEDGIPRIGSYVPLSIQSDSMEDTLMTGDLIITKEYEEETLNEGDIISFFSLEEGVRVVKTHRIVEVKEAGEMVSYVTQGDNNENIDASEVAPGDIISVYDGTRMPFAGQMIDVFSSRYGFLFLIIVPLFGFFLFQLYKFIIIAVESKKEPEKSN